METSGTTKPLPPGDVRLGIENEINKYGVKIWIYPDKTVDDFCEVECLCDERTTVKDLGHIKNVISQTLQMLIDKNSTKLPPKE